MPLHGYASATPASEGHLAQRANFALQPVDFQFDEFIVLARLQQIGKSIAAVFEVVQQRGSHPPAALVFVIGRQLQYLLFQVVIGIKLFAWLASQEFPPYTLPYNNRS